MAVGRDKFRTNQEEYFEPVDKTENEGANANGNVMFIAVLAIGLIAATSLGVFLSFVR